MMYCNLEIRSTVGRRLACLKPTIDTDEAVAKLIAVTEDQHQNSINLGLIN